MIWESKTGLVTAEGVTANSGKNRFIKFKVDENNIEEGNAIIALKNGNTIYWSWHIWITGKEVANVSSGKFMLEPLGLKHETWFKTAYDVDRTIYIKLRQTRADGKGAFTIIKVIQKPGSKETGTAMFYQFGRKDPLLGDKTKFVTQANGYSFKEAAQNPITWAGQCNIKTGARVSTDGMYDWNTDHKVDNSYYNLWDAKNTIGNSYTGPFIKTVYDPSPAGFHVPRRAAFSNIQDGKYAGKPFLPTAGYYKPGVAADPKSNENGYDVFKGVGTGYIWTCEKLKWVHGTESAHRGMAAYTNGNHVALLPDTYPLDLHFGANVIPVKE